MALTRPIYHFELPLPPTVNHRLIPVRMGDKTRLITGPKMRHWKAEAARLLGTPDRTFGDQTVYLRLRIKWPDLRKRDIDGPVKPLMDALTAAGVWDDDSQVRQLLVEAVPRDYGLQEPGTVAGQVADWEPF